MNNSKTVANLNDHSPVYPLENGDHQQEDLCRGPFCGLFQLMNSLQAGFQFLQPIWPCRVLELLEFLRLVCVDDVP